MPENQRLCSTVMNVELRHLRALVAISDVGTITEAASVLRITQPALSRTLEQLETQLGAKLVERTTRSLTFTARGERLCEQARLILDRVDSAVAEAAAEPRPLRVGFGRGALGKLTVPLLQGWRDEHEECSVQVHHRDDPEAALHRGEVDVAFLRGTPTDGSALHLLPLYEEPRVAVVPRSCALARQPSTSLADLAAYPVALCSTAATTTVDLWPEAGRPCTVTVDNNAEWLTTIAMGDAVGITAVGSQQDTPPDGVSYLTIVDAPPVPVSLAWTRSPTHPAVYRWRDHTVDALRVTRRALSGR